MRNGGHVTPTQGILFGFGVSGHDEPSIFQPKFILDADWLTGGAFGLEASLPGLIAITALLAWLWIWKPAGHASQVT